VNLGNPVEHTMLELAERIIALCNSRSTIVFKPLPSDDPVRRRPDISLARSMLEWEPSVSLSEGLQRTIDYFRQLRAALPDDEASAAADMRVGMPVQERSLGLVQPTR
jgi:UDP-glucuronate decarboxylase